MISFFLHILIYIFSNIEEDIELLVGLFLWTIPGNYLFGILPQESAILYASKYVNPIIITVVVAVGSLIAEILNYHTIRRIDKIPKVNRYFKQKAIRKSIEWFKKAPYITLAVITLLPIIPIFPLRVIAPLSKYPIGKYLAATSLGRVPRVYLFALFGFTVQVPLNIILLLVFIPVSFLFISRFHRRNDNSINELQSLVLKKSVLGNSKGGLYEKHREGCCQ
jgi:membrane protein DedA with SNARE-associated domain